ncbi:hypothetical protein Tco_1321475 [Tanacetum coccineum]
MDEWSSCLFMPIERKASPWDIKQKEGRQRFLQKKVSGAEIVKMILYMKTEDDERFRHEVSLESYGVCIGQLAKAFNSEIGLWIAVGISFAKILLQVNRPLSAILGKIPQTSV